jgi:hypothetical protein
MIGHARLVNGTLVGCSSRRASAILRTCSFRRNGASKQELATTRRLTCIWVLMVRQRVVGKPRDIVHNVAAKLAEIDRLLLRAAHTQKA